MAYPIAARYPTLAPHSESQAELTVPAGETVSIKWMPSSRHEAYLPMFMTFYNTEPDVFNITADHPDMKKHSVKLSEDFLTFGWRPLKFIVVTVESPLLLTIENTDTANDRFFGATIHHFAGPNDRIKRLAERLEKELLAETTP